MKQGLQHTEQQSFKNTNWKTQDNKTDLFDVISVSAYLTADKIIL